MTKQPARSRNKPISRPRGRPKADGAAAIAKEDLLDAALEAFAELGYEGMSMRELARRLHISHGLLNVRFGSKEDLWRMAVDEGLRQLAGRISAASHGGSVEEKLRNASVALLEGLAASPSLLQIINYEGARQTPRYAYIRQTLISHRYTMIDEIVAEGVAQGKFRDIPSALVFILLAHGGGVVFCLKPLARSLGLAPSNDAEEIRAKAEVIADLVIRGLKV